MDLLVVQGDRVSQETAGIQASQATVAARESEAIKVHLAPPHTQTDSEEL